MKQLSSSVHVDSWKFAACGGDHTEQVNSEEPAGNKFDLVGFTFGGDDVGFANTIEDCILWTCPTTADVTYAIDHNLAYKFGGYEGFLNNIAQHYTEPNGNILVLGYPAIVEDPSRWSGWDRDIGFCNGLARDQAEAIRGWAGELNQAIGEAVVQFNAQSVTQRDNITATFVNVQDGGSSADNSPDLFDPSNDSASHNLCGSDSWITGIEDWQPNFLFVHTGAGVPDVIALGITPSGFHPKVAGSGAMGALAAQAIDGMNWSLLGSGPPGAAPPSGPNPTNPASGPAAIAAFTGSAFTTAVAGGAAYRDEIVAGHSYSIDGACYASNDIASNNGWWYRNQATGHWAPATLFTRDQNEMGAQIINGGGGCSASGPGVQPPTPTTSPPITSTTSPSSTSTTTTTGTSTTTTLSPQEVEFYNNYGASTVDVTNCAGGTSPDGDPGGSDTQTFTIPGDIVSLDHIVFEADNGTATNSGVEIAATLDDNGAQIWSGTVHPNDDTTMSFGNVSVIPNTVASLTFNWSSNTSGHVDSIYLAGTSYGTFTASNTCAFVSEVPGEFVSNLSTSSSSLRAQIYGWTG